MAQLIQYINYLSPNDVKLHFTQKGFRVTESGDLYMLSVANDLSFGDNESNEFKSAIVHCVGTILNKTTNQIMCYGFPKTEQLKVSDESPFSGSITASDYIDGTLLKAFFDGSTWRLCTNGVINAYESYWISNKSFGELFDECLASNLSSLSLDQTCSYQFILKHPSVHLNSSDVPILYHVGTFSNTELQYVDKKIDNPNVLTPSTYTFNTYSEVLETMNSTKDCRGYIMYSNVTQYPRYKLLEEKYQNLRELIGNTPNMYLRYLECKAEGTSDMLLKNFPKLRYHSAWVDKSLGVISKAVLQSYVEKFILKNKELPINFYYRPIVYDLHGNYMKTQQKVTYMTVYNLLSTYHPKRLNFILNGLKFIQTGDFVEPIKCV
jgi:hypothetical protein